MTTTVFWFLNKKEQRKDIVVGFFIEVMAESPRQEEKDCCWGCCFFKSKESALTPLIKATIVVEIEKATQGTSIGISMQKVPEDSSIKVYKVAKDGLLEGSDIKVGQTIVSINNVKCPSSLKETVALLKGAPAGTLRIEVTDV